MSNITVQSIEDTVKVRRAWNGRLSNINELLSWMYEEDILNRTLKAKKDRIFRTYYRYYNDGDIPKGFKHSNKEWTEKFLENSVNDLIAEILRKTHGKYDRQAFRKQRRAKVLQHLYNMTMDYDCHSLFTYWAEQLRIGGMDAYNYFNMTNAFNVYTEINDAVNDHVDAMDQSHVESYERISTGHTMNYRIEQLKEKGNPIPEELYNKVCHELRNELNVIGTAIRKEMNNA